MRLTIYGMISLFLLVVACSLSIVVFMGGLHESGFLSLMTIIFSWGPALLLCDYLPVTENVDGILFFCGADRGNKTNLGGIILLYWLPFMFFLYKFYAMFKGYKQRHCNVSTNQ